MEKTEKRYWQNGIRFDKLYMGGHFLHIYFRVGSFGFAICQPFRANNIITIYRLI